ncbi:(2Fe-2S)-binding protein (plasmid) [Mesorhizobium sp. B2-1-8]|uniref:(2Fe-2S)-binding protein n=1 Tax=Mesorhizobium sp. B2-1-8 TaxID=2589967 RepID=UPI001127653C|nr:(2Fe-2S)-binding protein [Mesorhizobium sp. B2-1-8]UCI22930.1 (2Fe-2S)-binding protein [Mesorhizobium sp. B2-1-8]
MKVSVTVNGSAIEAEIWPLLRLSGFLRNALGLVGLKEGCCEGECGACTVLLDRKPVNSCLMLAFQAQGREILTIEGLGKADLSGLQQAFLDTGAVQCGYCTPGMILAAEGLLLANPCPDEAEIRQGLAGNICRCTGFATIVQAVASEAAARQGMGR